MKKRTIAVITAAAMAAGFLAGCAGSAEYSQTSKDTDIQTEDTAAAQTDGDEAASPEGQTITFWHSMGGVNGEAIEYLIDKFNSENTYGITVDAQYQGSYDDAINKLRSAQIGN